MAAQIVSLSRRTIPLSRDWSQAEIAEFYRVESALVQAGLALETDRGLTDEGDPWFAFCRADTGEVFIHFARIDGRYVVAGVAFAEPAMGIDFAALVRDLVSRHPLATADALPFARRRTNSNVFLHPAALLIAVVGAAFFHTGSAKAAEVGETTKGGAGSAGTSSGASMVGSTTRAVLQLGNRDTLALETSQATAILTAAMIGLNDFRPTSHVTANAIRTAPESSLREASHPLAGLPLNSVDDLFSFGRIHVAAADSAQPTDRSSFTLPVIKSILALTAVLNDLANHSTVPVQYVRPAGVTVPIHEASVPTSTGPITTAHSSPIADQSFLLVHFHVDALPDIEATQAVQASGALAYVDPSSISQTDRLSEPLIELIKRGSITAILPDSQNHFGDYVDLKNYANVPDSSPNDPVNGKSTALHASTAMLSLPVLPISQTAASAMHVYNAHDPQVAAAVFEFASQAPQLDMVVTGHDILLMDSRALEMLPSSALDAVTFNFDDGSTISLVGTIQELAGSHLLQ